MKKSPILLKLFCCVCLTINFFSCTKDPATIDLQKAENGDRFLLAALGYDTAKIVEYDDYYTLPPDIIVSKDRLEDIRCSPPTRMQKDPAGFLSKEYQTIYVSDKWASDLTTNLHNAIDEWNKLEDCNLKFVVDNNAIRTVQLDYGYDGEGFNYLFVERPDRGQYGTHIRINLSQEKWGTIAMDPTLGKYLIMHALGHIVGFSHAVTDPMVTTPQPNYILGTSINDPFSIMRSENEVIDFIERWRGFSRSDRQAIKQIYPYIPSVVIEEKTITVNPAGTGTGGDYLSLGRTYQITAKYVHSTCPNPIYAFNIDKMDFGQAGHRASTIKNGKISVVFTRPGIYEVSATVTNAQHTTFSKTFYVPAQEPWIEAPTTVSLNVPAKFEIHCWNPQFPHPFFCITANETAFNNPDVSISPITSLHEGVATYLITFRQPGEYTLTAFMQNGPTNKTSECFVNIYCQSAPYKIARDSIGSYEYSNRIRFFNDTTQTIEKNDLPNRIVFNYQLKFETNSHLKSMQIPFPSQSISQDSVFMGKYKMNDDDFTLPNTFDQISGRVVDKQSGHLLLICNKPYFEISFPKNKIRTPNPYDME